VNKILFRTRLLAGLVVCWMVCNAPVLVFMRSTRTSPTPSVEALFVLLVVAHHLALPLASLVCRERLWSKLRRFVRSAVTRRKPRGSTVNDGTPPAIEEQEPPADGDTDGYLTPAEPGS